ncbi:hypothetical protein L209DRAFT_512932 [Thermothelomyces heterothallicus CBS 203.75]
MATFLNIVAVEKKRPFSFFLYFFFYSVVYRAKIEACVVLSAIVPGSDPLVRLGYSSRCESQHTAKAVGPSRRISICAWLNCLLENVDSPVGTRERSRVGWPFFLLALCTRREKLALSSQLPNRVTHVPNPVGYSLIRVAEGNALAARNQRRAAALHLQAFVGQQADEKVQVITWPMPVQ